MIYFVIAIFFFLLGAIAVSVYLYWQLATGRRTVRPWNELFK